MFILDSLSLNGTAGKTEEQTKFQQSRTTFSASVFKHQENQNFENLKTPITANTTTSNEPGVMTTNKHKQQQQQDKNLQHLESQQKNKVVENFLIQKMPSPSFHKIKEMIKNNNENLNDEQALTAIENNTTITDNTMPQENCKKEVEVAEQKQQSNDSNINGNENICVAEWGKVPAINKRHHNCNNCNVSETTNRNASATTTATTTNTTATTATTTSISFKALNNDNAKENSERRVETKMLTNCIQNNVDLNTFALPPKTETAAATTTATTCLKPDYNSCTSCSCLPLSIRIKTATTNKGMPEPPPSTPSQPKTIQICSLNNDGDGFSAFYTSNNHDYDDNDYNADGGSLCHNSNNINDNNCYNNNTAYNTNNVILNKNNFLMLECSPLTCENEREQQTRNLIQNGNKNTENAATVITAANSAASNVFVYNNSAAINKPTMAEYSFVWGEPELGSAFSNDENIKDPVGNLWEQNINSSIVSPVDSVLENFEKFLNSVKLENRNLHQVVAECDDLIDLSDEPKNFDDRSKEIKPTDESHFLKHHEKLTNSVTEMQVANIQNSSNFENLLYCDLNETLEEQHLLESKEILEAESVATTPAPPPQIETAKLINTLTKVNETERIGDNNNNSNALDILMKVEEVNETTAKTPVTCINFKTTNKNNNEENTTNIKETCAVMHTKESKQYTNSCKVTTVTAANKIETQESFEVKTKNQICSTKSIESISPLTTAKSKQEKNDKTFNLKLKANTNNCFNGGNNGLSFAEYEQQQQQQEQEQKNQIQQDQFTSAYTLRDFAKCLKPAPDEDLKYTLKNHLQNENDKENLQSFHLNLNKNKQITTNEKREVFANKDQDFLSEKEKVLIKQESSNEINLYNKIFPKETNLIKDEEEFKDFNKKENLINSQAIEAEINNENILLNHELKKFKDTQFLANENLSTPKFCLSKGPNAPTKDLNYKQNEKDLTIKENSNPEYSYNKDLDKFNNELKLNCYEEKIYTRENQNQQPSLLYLTFVWPTKNEGQVVTTRQRQDKDEQGEAFKEKAAKAENDNFGKRDNKVLHKTYEGTCNKKHVEGTHKEYSLNPTNSIHNDNGDLFEQRILIDKQNGEYKKQGPFKINSRQNFSIDKQPLEKHTSYKSVKAESVKEISSENNLNEKISLERENLKENLLNFQIENKESVQENKSEENKEHNLSKFFIKCENSYLNKTESVVRQQQENTKNILNLNQELKGLNETNEKLVIKHYERCEEQNEQVEDYLSLEEFEASQRLKRLLQQHQHKRTRYDTQPFNNYQQTKTTATTAEQSFESLKTEIAKHTKNDLCLTNNLQQQRVLNETTTDTQRTKANSCFITKANKLQADCEITLERSSSVLRAQAYKLHLIETKEIPQLLKDDTQNLKVNHDKENGPSNKLEKLEIVNKLKTKQLKEIEQKDLKASGEKENKLNPPQQYDENSPQAYVSKKVVRLAQQEQQSAKTLLLENDLTDKQQKQQQQLETIAIEYSENVRFPLKEYTADKQDTSLADKQPTTQTSICYSNLQQINKTKQILQQQQKEEEAENAQNIETNFEPKINEYKSAFVATKPDINKKFKPLTASNEILFKTKNPWIRLDTLNATNSLSEFDAQRLSDFFYINHLTNTLNNNNNNNNNNFYNYNAYNNNNANCLIAHVLPEQYPLYTTNFVQPSLQLPFCYDELFPHETTQQLKRNFKINDNSQTTTTTTTAAADINDLEENDLNSLSSNNSSPCLCDNCQLSIQQQQEIDQQRDRVVTLNELNETEAIKQQHQQQTIAHKMREVNGQLRGLLKKPNRPPPARKNRVVFDETRNEFFEADYIILIREDCAYDEEDEEPCTCGEHELVRLCCEEGCQCNYSTATTDDNRTPQSPKYAPPIEFVDEAALSPPDGYKDNGLKNTLGGALSGHIFGAQHLQQLQVIQRLQQQRAAMLAARNNTQIPPPPPPATANPPSGASVNQQSSTCTSSSPLNSSSTPASAAAAAATTVVSNNSMNSSTTQHSPDDDSQGVCTECAECAECAAKQLQQDAECNSPQCQDDLTASLGVPAVALLPIHTSSPERRMTQKEIIAGEERPRYVLQAQYKSSPVSERRIVREATEDLAANATAGSASAAITTTSPAIAAITAGSALASATNTTAVTAGGESDLLPPALPAKPGATSISNDLSETEKPPPIPPKENSPTTQISGILKGGKLWKQDSISQHSDDQNNTTSEDEAGSTSNGTIKRSVRFVTDDTNNDEVDGQLANADDEDNQINELIPIKKHSTLFKNALRPNSAVQQLFPSTVSHQTLTSEALRAFDESKRAGCLVSTLPGSAGDSDTLRRSMERNILRRSLIKKKAVKSDISLEDRIKQLTCGIDEDNDEMSQENGEDDNSKIEDSNDLSHRDSPAGEENPQKFHLNGNNSDKSFSPNSSVSSSSSGSSAYKKITEIFNREKKNQEKIMEMEENPIVIIPQECRCPAAPDLGMGVQVPVVHTQIHRTPPRQTEPKRQFLSTLAPLTACVAGNKDDLSSYYTLAAAHHHQAAQNAHAAEYNLAAMMAGEQNITGIPQTTGDEVRKVAPDVIAGTPGQEQQDELAAFAQQEANRTDKIKKRYSNEPTNTKEINKETNSDDDEGNDYGFNKRPSVRGIKPKFSSTNEILQQMQDQLSQQMPSVAHSQPLPQPMKSYTLPKQSSASAMTKQLQQQQPSPQNMPHAAVANSQQQLPQQQQICSAVAAPGSMQIPANAAIAQQQTEQRTWSFYSETGAGGEQQRLPVESAAAAMQQTYYQTLPAGAMFRHTMIHQHQQHGPEEAMLYAQNCQAMATTIEPQPHYGHYARSPTRRPESPPPLRNYHQTMVLIPYNAETYSQFAATNMDPKVAHIQRQNILEYQQVTQQTIRVPIGYTLPGMQLHVVAGRGHAAQYGTAAAAQTHHHQHQRIMTQRYQFAQEANMAGFSERGVPEGAAAVSHSDCTSSGMISPTTGQQIAMQQQQQQQQQQQLQQQGAQLAQQQQQQQLQQQQQQQVNCQQQQQVQPQIANNMQSAAQGSVYYAMNV